MDVKNITLNSHCFKMVKENATEETLCQKVKFALTPNRKLVPLKMTIFFFGCSAFSILPYLTIHMKVRTTQRMLVSVPFKIYRYFLLFFISQDIGISVENIAIIYAILPFTSLVSSPLVGFLADRLGSYTKGKK